MRGEHTSGNAPFRIKALRAAGSSWLRCCSSFSTVPCFLRRSGKAGLRADGDRVAPAFCGSCFLDIGGRIGG